MEVLWEGWQSLVINAAGLEGLFIETNISYRYGPLSNIQFDIVTVSAVTLLAPTLVFAARSD